MDKLEKVGLGLAVRWCGSPRHVEAPDFSRGELGVQKIRALAPEGRSWDPPQFFPMVSFLTVSFSTRSSRTRYPVPASSPTLIVPLEDTFTSGSIMSSFQ